MSNAKLFPLYPVVLLFFSFVDNITTLKNLFLRTIYVKNLVAVNIRKLVGQGAVKQP